MLVEFLLLKKYKQWDLKIKTDIEKIAKYLEIGVKNILARIETQILLHYINLFYIGNYKLIF